MQFALDVVGIGALNLDYIAKVDPPSGTDRAVPLSTRIMELLDNGRPMPEWGTEAAVDEATVYAALEAANASALHTALGGSAYNAINTLAQLQLDLRLGYVGVAGRVPRPGMSAIQRLREIGVDDSFVFRDNNYLCGVCFSYMEDGERTLLTHAGANAGMADRLEASFDKVVAYMANSRFVHVTSFLDERTPAELRKVLQAVKEVNPATLISFDPGHVWSLNPTEDIRSIVSLSDWLLLNKREFQGLGNRTEQDTDEDIAEHLLGEMASDRSVVIVKRRPGIHAWRRENGKMLAEFYPQVVVPDDQVEDATGAGDVFAAGLLAVPTGDRLQVELGSLLGMTLARHKLRYIGSHGHSQLGDVSREFIRTLDAARRTSARPPAPS